MAMNDGLEDWLKTHDSAHQSTAAESRVRDVESHIGCRLLDELHRVLRSTDAPMGFVGKSYIAFFNYEDLLLCWREAQLCAKGFVPFASDGGGEWYGIDSRLALPAAAFVLMPAIGMEWEGAIFLGATWDDFTLKRGNLFDHEYQTSQSDQ
jgi:hypothetical protein